MDTSLIVVKQLPVIEENLKHLSGKIDDKVNSALSMVCTEETVKTVKCIRADLNKEFEELEEQRKNVKMAIMSPYEEFEKIYKKHVSDKYKQTDITLGKRINEVETELKNQKKEKIKSYFDEYLKSKNIDFIDFDKAKINVTLTASEKSLKEQSKAFIDRIYDDLTLIETQEHKDEILVEYKKTLNCSQSITTVKTRLESIECEKQRRVELEERRHSLKKPQKAEQHNFNLQTSAVLSPPEPILPTDDPIVKVAFEVEGKLSILKKMKQFLIENDCKVKKQ